MHHFTGRANITICPSGTIHILFKVGLDTQSKTGPVGLDESFNGKADFWLLHSMLPCFSVVLTDVNDSSVSSTLNQMPTTTATAGSDLDFDMFAHSRQSFEQNTQALRYNVSA